MATISAQISDELMEKADQRSYELYNRQNRSAYIVDLIQRDLSGLCDPIKRNDSDCFVKLVAEFSDAEAEDLCKQAFTTLAVDQRHFLSHILKEAAFALSKLKKGQDWHFIKCMPPADMKENPDPDNGYKNTPGYLAARGFMEKKFAQINEEIENEIRKNKNDSEEKKTKSA